MKTASENIGLDASFGLFSFNFMLFSLDKAFKKKSN